MGVLSEQSVILNVIVRCCSDAELLSAVDGVGANGATIKINPNINVNARFMLCRFGCNVIGNVYRNVYR